MKSPKKNNLDRDNEDKVEMIWNMLNKENKYLVLKFAEYLKAEQEKEEK